MKITEKEVLYSIYAILLITDLAFIYLKCVKNIAFSKNTAVMLIFATISTTLIVLSLILSKSDKK